MTRQQFPPRPLGRGRTLAAFLLVPLLLLPAALARQGETLRIGTSGSIGSASGKEEKGALRNLKDFIKDETGMDNEILRQSSWQEVAAKLSKKELDVGVFQGYEFAWAQAKYPALKPLAVAVNVYQYPVAYVVARNDDSARDFAGLKGKALGMPDKDPQFVRLYVDRQAQAQGAKDTRAFFSKITEQDSIEGAIDDVVDGDVQAAAVDRAALEAYKERKPGRFKRLKPVAQSHPFPPPVVAYYDSNLAEATLQRLRTGLLEARNKDRGQTMLTLFGLTGFQPVPSDFGKVLAEIREAYPPQNAKAE